MATRSRYFRTDSSAGGNGTEDRTDGVNRAYPTLNALLAAEGADLVAAGDILHAITTQSGLDTTLATVSGFTTGVANYILIEAQGAARNNGVSREKSGTGYQINTTNDTFRILEDYVRVTGLELVTNSTNEAFDIQSASSGANDVRANELIIARDGGTGSNAYPFGISANSIFSLTNCLIIGGGDRGIDARNGTITIDHCGFIVGGTLGIVADDSVTITNTWSINASAEDFWTGGNAPSGSHNASEDASVSTDYANSVASITVANEFTNPTNVLSTADFTLKDSVLNAAGTGSEAIDITGAARTGTPDIGPFNFAAAGGDRDIIATLAAVSIAAVDTAINVTRNLVATATGPAVADLDSVIGQERDISASLVAVAIGDIDAGVKTDRELLATLSNVAAVDLDAVVSFGGNRDITATSVNIGVGDVDSVVSADRDITATLIDVTVAKLNAVIGRARDIIATVVNVVVGTFNATVTGPDIVLKRMWRSLWSRVWRDPGTQDEDT